MKRGGQILGYENNNTENNYSPNNKLCIILCYMNIKHDMKKKCIKLDTALKSLFEQVNILTFEC